MKLIVLPNQLFPIENTKNIAVMYIIEEPRYFTDYRYHKMKLMYHRASCKKYYDKMKDKIKCIYKEYYEVDNKFYESINELQTVYYNPIDHKMLAKLVKKIPKATMIDNLNFLMTPKEIAENKDIFYKNGKYYHDKFYKLQRHKLDILLDDNNKPIGNKYSYDTENRNNITKDVKIPKIKAIKKDKYYHDAKQYIDKHFESNYGETEEWIYPIDTKNAIKFFDRFMKERIDKFGKYEDASDKDNTYLFHSVISPMMNIGILPDSTVIKLFKKFYNKNKSKIINNITSYEGFIRQVIGWRNYVYAIYLLEPDLYNMNHLKHHNKLSDRYWTGDTEIEPIDIIIGKIRKYAYVHHIERLMHAGLWFLINEIDPKEVHRIFMEWTIDAYDWVMVPNVMGMSQYADGGKMMTRIYLASSNYIIKMSNIKKGAWCVGWDALYYRFISRHRKILKHNYATSRQVKHWDNKSDNEKKILIDTANELTNDVRCGIIH